MKKEKTYENMTEEELNNEIKKEIKNKKRIQYTLIAMIIFIVFGIYVVTEIIDEINNPINRKPVIYLYPTETTEVTVKLGKPEELTHTYPKYTDEWKVVAKPNGDLTDIETGRNLYCLYWEGIDAEETTKEDGFIVKGEDTTSFLEEKLEILGLTEREANEFIIYWLPKLESNKYNYIRFKTMEEIDASMPLEIEPKPDTVIRVLMQYKALEKPIEVKEQQLTTVERSGFTVVEWGGEELN